MIRFRLKEIIADKEFREGKRISFEDISKTTGVHRSTLSKIAGVKGYNTTTNVIDALCQYFGCTVGSIMEYIPNNNTNKDL